MTSEDAFHAEPTALEDAVFEHRLDHVLATSGRVAAGRRGQWRNEHPVKIDREQKHFPNESSPPVIVRCLSVAGHEFSLMLSVPLSG